MFWGNISSPTKSQSSNLLTGYLLVKELCDDDSELAAMGFSKSWSTSAACLLVCPVRSDLPSRVKGSSKIFVCVLLAWPRLAPMAIDFELPILRLLSEQCALQVVWSFFWSSRAKKCCRCILSLIINAGILLVPIGIISGMILFITITITVPWC